MTHPPDIAVIGAETAVGAALLVLLHERGFAVGRAYALAFGDGVGEDVNFGQPLLSIGDVATFDFARVRLAFFCATPEVSRVQVPRAVAAGCAVIDASDAFGDVADIPLVAPPINAAVMARHRTRGLFACPGDVAVPLVTVLKPIAEAAGIERIDVVTLEPVASAGQWALDELGRQTADLLNFRDVEPQQFPKQIAFNVLPQVGPFDAQGHGASELRAVRELRRLLADPSLPVSATAVRVPVFYGFAAAVHLETTRKLSADEARRLIAAVDGVEVLDRPLENAYPTPVTEASGSDKICVGRVREAPAPAQGLNLWLVSDNIRRGTALNCVLIAEWLTQSESGR